MGDGRQRMKQRVKVHFFGKFCLEKDTAKLDEQVIHSKKVTKLLAYFLLNCNRMISVEELGELIWGNGGSSNPMGALKNLVYRLRNVLKKLGPEDFILSRSGMYGWNTEIEVQSDMEEFKYYVNLTRHTESDIRRKIQKLEQAAGIYRKPETSVLICEPWMAVKFTSCHSMYMKLIQELCESYSQVKEYEKIQKICDYAMSCDELNEDIHYWYVKSWVELGKADHARKQYDMAVKILYEGLGVGRSLKMQELYEDILRINDGFGYASIDDIYDDIREDDPKGTFFCEYSIFREIYRLEVRRTLRSGAAEYVILLTVEVDEKEKMNNAARIQYHKKRGMQRLYRILMKNLRMGDVAARYSDEQYIILLPYCNYEDSQKVIRRLIANFNKDMHDPKILINAQTREVSMEYDIQMERKGDGGWNNGEGL